MVKCLWDESRRWGTGWNNPIDTWWNFQLWTPATVYLDIASHRKWQSRLHKGTRSTSVWDTNLVPPNSRVQEVDACSGLQCRWFSHPYLQFLCPPYFSHLQNRRFTLGLLSSFCRSPVAPETIRRHSNGLHTQNWKWRRHGSPPIGWGLRGAAWDAGRGLMSCAAGRAG